MSDLEVATLTEPSINWLYQQNFTFYEILLVQSWLNALFQAQELIEEDRLSRSVEPTGNPDLDEFHESLYKNIEVYFYRPHDKTTYEYVTDLRATVEKFFTVAGTWDEKIKEDVDVVCNALLEANKDE